MLTSFPDDDLLDAVVAGASGYVLKQVRGSDLVDGPTGGHRTPLLDPVLRERAAKRIRSGPEETSASAT